MEALLFLAKWHKERGDLTKALEYAKPLQDYSGHERDEANKLIGEINSLA